MKDISKILGHSDVQTTMNIYNEIQDKHKVVVDNIPQEEFERAQNPTRTFDNIPTEELKGRKIND